MSCVAAAELYLAAVGRLNRCERESRDVHDSGLGITVRDGRCAEGSE
jgi:hypothetical protein